MTDIFAVQDEIAGAVVRQLKITLLGAAPMAKETDPRAYALFLQGRQLNRQGTPDAWEQAISLNQQVLAIDPAYVPAWNNLALIYGNQAGNGLRPVDAGFRLAREAASKALAIDADYAPAYSRLGWIAMMYEGDLAAAARHYEHALALEPANLGIINDAAILAVILGRLDTAISLLEYAADRDPVNPAGHDNVGNAYLLAGRLDEAITSFRATLSLSPGFMASRSRIGMALLLKGEPEAALAAMRQESYPYWQLIGMATACHTLGQKVASDAALKQLIEKHQKDSAYNIASVLAWRAEPDRAFAWLDKAVASHDTSMPEIAVQPLFADLHSDSRWLPFLRKLGKAPEQLAAIKFDVKVPQ